MTKKLKSILTITAVVVLACAMAATVFAATATRFGPFITNGYSGEYNAVLNVTKERTDASLKNTIKQGPGFVSTAASTVSCVVMGDNDRIGHFFNAGATECEGYCIYDSNDGYDKVVATCEYHFYSKLLCTLTEEPE